jgi:hypothetical protein
VTDLFAWGCVVLVAVVGTWRGGDGLLFFELALLVDVSRGGFGVLAWRRLLLLLTGA